ncbi:NUDIX hydrolase [Nocardia iowensis]|uniref:NUDIX domain-containing protein n=1 Tax=Nocardia iowensis TaxID=204891 RepID=A0ABX8RX87_NOCIO|nr:NUDIX domain-containing protein [Nocardia iowensis]QXN94269.1 NUDIX domain-containing protein [Nocardia iowensis]
MVIDKVAWIHVVDGKVLSTRSRGKDVYYLPGGKRELGESDTATLAREVLEELTVRIDPTTARHIGTFEAQAHGHPDGVVVRMTCYTADFEGSLAPASEIAEIVWLTGSDRDSVPPVDQLIFTHLQDQGLLDG